MKTRTKKSTRANGTQSQEIEQDNGQTLQLSKSVQEPPRLTILPQGLSDDARIITLPINNASQKSGRYLICPERGIFEFTTVGDPKEYQSWLLTPTGSHIGSPEATSHVDGTNEAFVLRDPYLFIATPIDPLFIMLPMMVAADVECPGMYRTLTDITYDDATTAWRPLRQLLADDKWWSIQRLLEQRMATVADVLQLGDGEDATYRLSVSKLAAHLLRRALKTVDTSFPPSLDKSFVSEALELPTHDIVSSEEVYEAANLEPSSLDSQPSISDELSQETSIAAITEESVSTNATSISSMPAATLAASGDIKRLLRIRTTYEFMLRSYVPRTLHRELLDTLSSTRQIIDFQPLTDFEKLVASKRSEVQALRTLSDNISRKRTFDDDEAAGKAEEKRRKKEEEDARKKSMSHGVKKLMKADTSGMKKLSSFFTKTPAK